MDNEERKKLLDNLFMAFSVAAENVYFYACDIRTGLSRWSEDAVLYYDMPGEYMEQADVIWEERIHPQDREGYRKSLDALFAGDAERHDQQYRVRNAEGNYVVCTGRGVSIRDPQGTPDFFCGILRNHGEQSHIDPVTGLLNQYAFFEELRGLSRKQIPFNIMLIGISRFSEINNVYGYTTGNRVLQSVAQTILTALGEDGRFFRMDGAKYAIVTTKLTEEEMSIRFRERKAALISGLMVDGIRHSIVFNGGMLRVDSFDVDDQAIYACLNYAYDESKDHQLGELVIFHNAIDQSHKHTLEMIHVIRDSILDGCRGFYLCYQPIMDASSETLSGMEALVRWRDEYYGEVPPNTFIPILEKDVMFPKLGDWILRRAMTDGRVFLKRYPDFVMNVNLSYAQMEKADFVSTVISILKETGYPPQNLCLEITERCRLLNLEMLKDIIQQLSSLGVKFALDDFGTGYSSISILKELPLDIVKIDREFVKDIEKDAHSVATVEHISELASVYGSHVCVEGIETAGMRDHLRRFPVDSFQGYYYSKPIPFDNCVQAYVG